LLLDLTGKDFPELTSLIHLTAKSAITRWAESSEKNSFGSVTVYAGY